MKILAWAILVLIISATGLLTAAQKPLAAYSVEGTWHFVDHSGNTIFTKDDITAVFGYSEGLYRVRLKHEGTEKWAFLDSAGNTAIITDFDGVNDFREGMAIFFRFKTDAHVEREFGFINKKGEIAIPNIYLDVQPFSEGLAFVMNKSEAAFIDTSGKKVIDMKGKVAGTFSDGLAPVSDKSYRMGYIDKKGNTAIGFYYDEASNFSDGFARINQNGRFGFIDATGDTVIPTVFYRADDFNEGYTFVGRSAGGFKIRWALIDKKYHSLSGFDFSDRREFSEGLAAVKKDSLWGYIDSQGEPATEFKFSRAEKHIQGLAWVSVKEQNIRGYIDKQGDFIIKLPAADIYIDLRLNKRVR